MDSDGACDEDAALVVARPALREKKSIGAAGSALLDAAGSGILCDAFLVGSGAACCLEVVALELAAGAAEGVDFGVAGLSPSIARNASLFLVFALLLDAAADSAPSVGEASRRMSSLMLSGASVIVGPSESCTALAAFLASTSFFLSARISSSLRLGAGSMPKSECFDDEALLEPSLDFLLPALDSASSSDSFPLSLPLAVVSVSTLITLRLVAGLAGGGRDRPLPLEEFAVLDADEGEGSFEASPDFGGGSNEPSFEEDGLLTLSGVVFETA